jgi:hypothetical protein
VDIDAVRATAAPTARAAVVVRALAESSRIACARGAAEEDRGALDAPAPQPARPKTRTTVSASGSARPAPARLDSAAVAQYAERGEREAIEERMNIRDDGFDSAVSLGAEFARALSAKDFAGITNLLHPAIDFRALTPRRPWEASTAEQVIDEVLRVWFGEREIEELTQQESDAFVDCSRIAYRLRGHDADGPFVIEQQAYLSERDGRIGWMRVLCSGFRRPSANSVSGD